MGPHTLRRFGHRHAWRRSRLPASGRLSAGAVTPAAARQGRVLTGTRGRPIRSPYAAGGPALSASTPPARRRDRRETDPGRARRPARWLTAVISPPRVSRHSQSRDAAPAPSRQPSRGNGNHAAAPAEPRSIAPDHEWHPGLLTVLAVIALAVLAIALLVAFIKATKWRHPASASSASETDTAPAPTTAASPAVATVAAPSRPPEPDPQPTDRQPEPRRPPGRALPGADMPVNWCCAHRRRPVRPLRAQLLHNPSSAMEASMHRSQPAVSVPSPDWWTAVMARRSPTRSSISKTLSGSNPTGS